MDRRAWRGILLGLVIAGMIWLALIVGAWVVTTPRG